MRAKFSLLATILVLALLAACGGADNPAAVTSSNNNFAVNDWTPETHGKDTTPNYSEVFDSQQVKRLDIIISSENWHAMLTNLTDKYGVFGENSLPTNTTNAEENPSFVPADVFYKGRQWYQVGIRFKGNSSLKNSWLSGILKLPFKLDFDEFEDDYPAIKNQRFYGFKKLSLKNNYFDKSLLREKVVSDIFLNYGLPASHTAFIALYVDHGEGAKYFGLYTLVEEVDDTVIKTQFLNNAGNLYKPENNGATLNDAAYIERDFEKKTNEDIHDWSDVNALFDALHDPIIHSDAANWRKNLEATFEVDKFLKYLAVNQVVQNWDSYGKMPHNYFLYNNPENSKLTWIPWDHNETLQEGRLRGALNLDFSNLQRNTWPLIEKLLSDTIYRDKYKTYLNEVINGPFELTNLLLTYDNYLVLLAPYAEEETNGYTFLSSPNDFRQEITTLIEHAANRIRAVNEYLGN